MDRRIEARIAALEAELASLKQMVAATPHDGAPTSDRRGVVKLLAASAVGAVTGAAFLTARPAAAADGDPLLQGKPNDATSMTSLYASADTALSVYGAGGYGIEANGGAANALFIATGLTPLGSNASNIGELYVDESGDWWAATIENSPTGWRKLAGPGTAGQLHVLPKPVRVYDSRPGEAPADITPKSPTVGNTPRTIDTTGNASGVPTTANAVLVNLTITEPRAAGYATAWPTGTWPGTSSINFAPGQNIAATTVVGCGTDATIQIQSNTVTDFLIDVIGYYQ